MRNQLIASLCSTFLLVIVPVGGVLAEESDFDSDGNSDLTMVSLQEDGDLEWKKFLSTTDTLTEGEVFGVDGNHLILANWLDSAVPEIGVVGYDTTSKAVVWKIKSESAEEKLYALGDDQDYVVSGADVDGSGLTDAIIVREVKKRLRWTVALDPFASSTPTTRTINLGNKGGLPFFVRTTAGRDSIAVFGPAGRNFITLRVRDLVSNTTQIYASWPKRFLESGYSKPFIVRKSDGTDLIGFAVSSSNLTKFYFRNINGEAVSRVIVQAGGDVVVGEYLSDYPGQEVLVKAAGSEEAIVFNPTAGEQSTITVGEGIVVDSINVNQIEAPEVLPSEPSPGCKSTREWPENHIYKTVGSDHFNPMDPRRNSLNVIIKVGGVGPFPNCLIAEDSQGNVIAKLGLYEKGNGWAARYYAGIGCGFRYAMSGEQAAAEAKKKSGSKYIYINFGKVCSGPINAATCIGSNHC